jgi:tetratricopeptide (TPR) repeat protein
MIGGKVGAVVAAEELPALAMSLPARARDEAVSILAEDSSAEARTYALHALGIIDRDTGRVGRAIAHLRRGVALAEVAHLDDRKVDLAASLATAYALAGQRSAMHRVFDEALRVTHGVAKARILVRRGGVLVMLGDHHGAYRDCTQAAELLHRARDPTWEAHARTNTAYALLMLGRFEEADEQYELAQELSEGLGEEYAATITLHSRGDCAHRKGDLPRALRLLYQARDRYQDLGSCRRRSSETSQLSSLPQD